MSAPKNKSHGPVDLAKVSALPISQLDFSPRTNGILVSEKLDTIGKLLHCSIDDLMKIPYLGSTSIREIEAKLAYCGLHLSVPLPKKPSPE